MSHVAYLRKDSLRSRYSQRLESVHCPGPTTPGGKFGKGVCDSVHNGVTRQAQQEIWLKLSPRYRGGGCELQGGGGKRCIGMAGKCLGR